MAIDVRTLVGVIADYPVLPPPGRLPPDSEELRTELGEIASGARSAHATLVREVAATRRVTFEELVRRAGFVLACVALPSHGTHYELLGVSPRASSREIRQRWAALIQRYHPDHTGPEGGLGDQARRLIEAYQTLRDPDRRRYYDAELARARGQWRVAAPVEAPGSWRKLAPSGPWRWAPVVIVALGIIVVIAMTRWTSPPLPNPTRPALRPSLPAVGDAAPGEQLLDSPLRPPRRADTDVMTVEPENRASSPVSPAPFPSLVSQLAGLELPKAPAAADTSADVPAEEERREMSAGDVATPSVRSRSASELPPQPVAAATGTLAASAPERKPPSKSAAAAASPAATAVPSRVEPKKSIPEGWSSLIETFRGAYERKDLGVLSALFADDVRERSTVGRGAVQQLYVTNFGVLDRIRYEVFQVIAHPGLKEGEVLVQGRFRIRAVAAKNGSRPLDVSGPIRWTLRREGEALRIVAIDYDVGAR